MGTCCRRDIKSGRVLHGNGSLWRCRGIFDNKPEGGSSSGLVMQQKQILLRIKFRISIVGCALKGLRVKMSPLLGELYFLICRNKS